MRPGIAFRPELATWLATSPRDVKCVELSVDDVLAETPPRVERLPQPVVLQAARVSLGTSRLGDAAELERLASAVRAVEPLWVAAYLGCRDRPEVEPSYPQPVSLTRASLGRVVANCRQLADACGRPVLVENVAAFGSADGSLTQAQFLNRLCGESGCSLLVDVTALTIDSRLGFRPERWLWDVEPAHVTALHLGDWARRGVGRWTCPNGITDYGESSALARELAARTPVTTAILRPDTRPPDPQRLEVELRSVAALGGAAAPELGRSELALAIPV